MGYMHINNLYRDRSVLMFSELYALEKIHGTSAHVAWKDGELRFFSGGAKHEQFVSLFDKDNLAAAFGRVGHQNIVVYGEAYGGKMQAMSSVYGKDLKFIAFDVLHRREDGERWLNIKDAEAIVAALGLEFVHYSRIPSDLEVINFERDYPSEQSFRNGVADRHKPETYKYGEGIVLRPLSEFIDCRGNRVIAKHKREEFVEMTSKKHVLTLEEQGVLIKAEEIANQYVNDVRFQHVIDKFRLENEVDVSVTGAFIQAFVADICREAEGEFHDTKEARRAIGKKAGQMYRHFVTNMEAE